MCVNKTPFFDETEVRRAIELLKPDGELFEIRIIGGGKSLSGYFRGADQLINELRRTDLQGMNVYFTLQQLHEGCEARIQWQRFVEIGRSRLPATSDGDVTKILYIPVDVDPIRPAGISSSADEIAGAEEVCNFVIEYMVANGFDSYVKAFSGNGWHSLFRAPDLPVKDCALFISRLLNRLDELFGNEMAKVDTGNFNPSRIFKLYGTLAQKGRSTDLRPHRIARIEEAVKWSSE